MSTLRERMRAGENLVGTMVNIMSHPDIPRILQSCGFDFFIIDCEHGSFDYSQVASMVAVAKAVDLPVLVRIPGALREPVLRLMEMGADGLMLPSTDTPELARKLVEYAKYAPMGKRGMSMMRAHNRYIPVPDPVAYMKQANEDTILIAQIESAEGVGNIDEILSIDGIDVAFMGPNDLCCDLGVTGNQKAPEYLECVDKVIAAAKRHGKYCGNHCMTPAAYEQWHGKGMNFNLYSNEVNMIMGEAKRALTAMREQK